MAYSPAIPVSSDATTGENSMLISWAVDQSEDHGCRPVPMPSRYLAFFDRSLCRVQGVFSVQRAAFAMARLAMTETMVDAIRLCNSSSIKGWPPEAVDGEPSLEDAAEGRPISYGQVIEISDILRRHNDEHEAQDVKTKDGEFKYDLNALLKGSRVYAEPSEPKDPKVFFGPYRTDGFLP